MELLLLATLDSGLTAHSFLHVFACSCAYNTSGSREQAFAKVVSRSYALCVEGNGTSGASGTDQVRGDRGLRGAHVRVYTACRLAGDSRLGSSACVVPVLCVQEQRGALSARV